MNLREQIRQRANRLRNVPLESVLRLHGAQPDRHDKRKWHTSRGILSINGAKFINWNRSAGGGGAIDLVIHLEGDCSFREALDWLQRHFPQHQPLEEKEPRSLRPALSLPPPDPTHLRRVRSYLVTQRALTPALIDPLIGSGTLYADAKANAVFLLQSICGIAIAIANGDGAVPVGAELRGTGSHQWRGMAPGSRKDHGYFSIPADLATAEDNRRPIILCESAIDAISCFALHPGHWCLSTSGARPNPAWLASLIDQNPSRPIYCGFDADDTGDAMARAMSAFHPQVQRLRPARHDWNAMLTSRA
jgi:hypothetical protein